LNIFVDLASEHPTINAHYLMFKYEKTSFAGAVDFFLMNSKKKYSRKVHKIKKGNTRLRFKNYQPIFSTSVNI